MGVWWRVGLAACGESFVWGLGAGGGGNGCVEELGRCVGLLAEENGDWRENAGLSWR